MNQANLLTVVYHSAAIGPKWKEIVANQFQECEESNITDVHFSHVGEESEFIEQQAKKHKINMAQFTHNESVLNYEIPAIQMIEKLAKDADKPIMYFHSKGVTRPFNDEVIQWRKEMMYYVVKIWRQNLKLLESFDTVGVHWRTNKIYPIHYSGNFWMANANYLCKQPPIEKFFESMNKSRFACEFWIGTGNPKAYTYY